MRSGASGAAFSSISISRAAIGPVARVLVRREAAAGSGLTELAGRLADQIPDPAARRGFLEAIARLG